MTSFQSGDILETYSISENDSDSDVELDIVNYKETSLKLEALRKRHCKYLFNSEVREYIQASKVDMKRDFEEVDDYDRFNDMHYDYYEDANYEISTLCGLTSPCTHYVRHTDTGKIYIMDGISICKKLKDRGVDVSKTHFAEYEQIVENSENMGDKGRDVLKKVYYAKVRIKKIDAKIAQLKKNYEENGKKYTASSRLDRLKKQHNIS